MPPSHHDRQPHWCQYARPRPCALAMEQGRSARPAPRHYLSGHRCRREQLGRSIGMRSGPLGMSIRCAICPEDRHVGRQFQLFDLQPGNPMFERAPQQVPVRRPAEITGLVYNSGRMLPRINTLFAPPALCDLGPDALYARKKLRLVVERGHHHMAPLPPRRVKAVVTDNKAPDTVVLRLNSAHGPKANPRHRHPKAPEAAQKRRLPGSPARGWSQVEERSGLLTFQSQPELIPEYPALRAGG